MRRNPSRAESSYPRRAGRADASRLALAAAGACLAVSLAGTVPAVAADNGLAISKPWVRLIIRERPAAGYFTLTNNGDKQAELVGASSPGCAMVMLHRSVRANGIDKMLPVESVAVPPHKSVSFAPGGYHLMCMKPTEAVTPGKTVPMTLKFKDGASVTTDFPVRNAMGN